LCKWKAIYISIQIIRSFTLNQQSSQLAAPFCGHKSHAPITLNLKLSSLYILGFLPFVILFRDSTSSDLSQSGVISLLLMILGDFLFFFGGGREIIIENETFHIIILIELHPPSAGSFDRLIILHVSFSMMIRCVDIQSLKLTHSFSYKFSVYIFNIYLNIFNIRL